MAVSVSRPAETPPPAGLPNVSIDAEGLERALRRRVDGEVRFEDGDRALYAADASNYRETPIGVVIPRSVDGLIAAVETAREHDAPILPRGCGTSLAGQCCNTAVVIDCSKYLNRVLEIDAANKRARVEPGVILDDLRAAARAHGLTFGPDPATHDRCTLGGMIGNDSCGIHSVLAEFYGPGPRTEHNIESLDVLTYDGTRLRVGPTDAATFDRLASDGGRVGDIYRRLRSLRDRYEPSIRDRFPNILRRVSGYNLPALLGDNDFDVARVLCGSEGTCVTTLEATVKLIPMLSERVLVVLGYPDVYDAADRVPAIREHRPVGLEGIDDRLISYMHKKGVHEDDLRLLPDGKGWLLVEFGADRREDALEAAHRLARDVGRGGNAPSINIIDDPAQQHRLWEIRESGLGATAFVPGEPDTWPGWEDSAVPVERFGEYLRKLRSLFDRYGYSPSVYGHFGQGCVHCRVDFDLTTNNGIADYRAFVQDAAELVTQLGGSLSGEHGDGQSRGELLPIMYGSELVEAFREFKAIWDPAGRMNPGKIVDALPLDRDLRVPRRELRVHPDTHFAYSEDHGSFEHATLRCVGVGACRRMSTGTMCPSFKVLREEKHTTRGRAHLLFEMMRGNTIDDGWKSEAVKESLDLCLSCKGCKGDCPVNVDIATYRAEFLSHYYKGRRRPAAAYAFGLINRWASLAAHAPAVANAFTQTPGLSRMAKTIVDMPAERRIPPFAPRSFTSWFREQPAPNVNSPVLLWADTFNNYFHPESLASAATVLLDAGYHVSVPSQSSPMCCGRPLYDYGMVSTARRRLQKIMRELAPAIDAGTPMVVLEPSCASVFRDELRSLFPGDERADRLANMTLTLGEFLLRPETAYEPPRLGGRVLYHGHCHHRAIMKVDDELTIMRRMGLDVNVPETGCCGMAGAFGFEADKYPVSKAIGEQILLPAVRSEAPDTFIVADGFSCREQIAQGTERRAMHLADVIAIALERGAGDRQTLPARSEPAEVAVTEHQPPALGRARVSPLAGLIAGVSILGLAELLRRTRARRAEHHADDTASPDHESQEEHTHAH